MIFEVKDLYIEIVENKDLYDIVDIYNSNKYFLINHIGYKNITYEWLLNEIESMIKIDFSSFKIIEKSSGNLIGIIDFKIDEETYLSLLMLHSDYKNKGFGKLIYKAFEDYLKSLKIKRIRIDVVTNYDDSVYEFWVRNGFCKFEDIELNWADKLLPAVIMKKSLI